VKESAPNITQNVALAVSQRNANWLQSIERKTTDNDI
jgi:hypothetical protein